MGALNETGVISARPSILIAGQDKPELATGLMSLQVSEDVCGLYRCEATFGNWGTHNGAPGYLYFDRSLLDFGKQLQVKVGDVLLFDGRIMALEAQFPEGAPPSITVLAEDRLQDLRMTRRTRSFSDKSDADVARQIANDHGLTPQINLDGPTHKLLAQVSQSDLAFLRERARLAGGEVWLKGSTLHLARRPNRSQGGTPQQLTLGNQLREFSVLADLAQQRTKLTVGGWDVAGKSAIKESAESSAISSETSGGDSGPAVLQQALGARAENLSHLNPQTGDEGRAQAEALLRMMSRRFVVGRGVSRSVNGIKVGAQVDLQGLGPLFSGQYYLAAVRHLFDLSHGLRSEFTAERPWLGRN